MKIAFFVGIFFPKPGGVQIQTHNIANTLVKMDNEVDLYLLNKSNEENLSKILEIKTDRKENFNLHQDIQKEIITSLEK